MEFVLIYFSQTGNTRKIASTLVNTFREAEHMAVSIPLRHATYTDATRGDLLGVGTSCFSGQAPVPVKDFLRTLPRLDGRPAFVFATCGGAPGRVLYDLNKILHSKGAHVVGGFLARGQVHHPAPHMIGKFRGRPDDRDLALARRFAIALTEHISGDRQRMPPLFRPKALKGGWGLYDLMGAIVSDQILRTVMPEPNLDPSRCDRCEWCINECPMDNIHLQPYPALGDRCIRCYRCLSGCPRDAFVADWRFADPFLQMLYNVTFMRLFGDLKPDEKI
jgi:ferredoxin/flavodoxin